MQTDPISISAISLAESESTYNINHANPVEDHVIINGIYDSRDHQLQPEVNSHEQEAHANGEHQALRH